MLKVPKPVIQTTDVYNACVQSFNNPLRGNLVACLPLVLAAEREFEDKITKGQIYTIPTETMINLNVTASQMADVYTNKMVRHVDARHFYDVLKQAAKHNLCPLCGHRDVTTLDHYLPKAEFPRLSVVPVNLIPACSACNIDKHHSYPATSEQETLHPYYDDIENDLWLTATVNRTVPLSITFSVTKATNWTDLLYERVKGHFQSFNLNNLYAIQAGRELAARKGQLQTIYYRGSGASGIKKILSEEANSRRKSNKNSWQTSMYSALSVDDWFCNEGFKNIAT